MFQTKKQTEGTLLTMKKLFQRNSMTMMIRITVLLSIVALATSISDQATQKIDNRGLQGRGGQTHSNPVKASHIRPAKSVVRDGDSYEEHYMSHSYSSAGKGGKGSKRNNKGAYDHEKDGKGGKKAKKAKKEKSRKKNIDKKLKHSADEGHDDDYYMHNDDEWHADALTEMSSPSTSPPSPTTMPVPTTEPVPSTAVPASGASSSNIALQRGDTTRSAPTLSPTQKFVTFQEALENVRGTGRIGPPVQSPITPPPRADVLTTRMADTATQSDAASVIDGYIGPVFGVPRVERELYPSPVLLKAHSIVHLQQYDPEIFTETTNLLTPCLQRSYPAHLQAYKLTVDYSDGPDATEVGVVITHMSMQVILSVVTDSIEELRGISHARATTVVHDCFEGPELYEYLGSIRRNGVEINEIAFQDEAFKSPVFGNNPPVSAIKSNGGNASPMVEESKKTRAGLIATLCVGMIAIGAVFLAHKGGKLPPMQISTNRLGHLAGSLRKHLSKERIGQVSQSILQKFSRSFGGSDQGSRIVDERASQSSSGNMDSIDSTPRERTWSGNLRRHPMGGIKPAALQQGPAFSEDYIKKPASPAIDDYSFSVGGDYNVPDEYDFQATPMSAMYNGKHAAPVPPPTIPSPSGSNGDEFSMPDDYNTVHEDVSIYSRNMSVAQNNGRNMPSEQQPSSSSYRSYYQSKPNDSPPSNIRAPSRDHTQPDPYSMVSPARSVMSSTRLVSPKEQYLDEWSMNSFTTSSPAPKSPAPTTQDPPEESTPPPYRHWGEPSKVSPGLTMPRLA